mmetsp:Transcript_32317/g.37417  ORF Transcript_32317/g.37417 Transcript_32317/m.37417 type:complete len:206 (-) Transcript_32317:176-793(-)
MGGYAQRRTIVRLAIFLFFFEWRRRTWRVVVQSQVGGVRIPQSIQHLFHARVQRHPLFIIVCTVHLLPQEHQSHGHQPSQSISQHLARLKIFHDRPLKHPVLRESIHSVQTSTPISFLLPIPYPPSRDAHIQAFLPIPFLPCQFIVEIPPRVGTVAFQLGFRFGRRFQKESFHGGAECQIRFDGECVVSNLEESVCGTGSCYFEG